MCVDVGMYSWRTKIPLESMELEFKVAEGQKRLKYHLPATKAALDIEYTMNLIRNNILWYLSNYEW